MALSSILSQSVSIAPSPRLLSTCFLPRGSYVALPDQKHTAHQHAADKINIKGKREAYFNVGSSINGQNSARWRLRTSKYADSGESEAAKYDLKDDDLKLAIPSLKAVYEFTRPYAAIGSIVATISSCLISIENLSDISLPFFIGILKALAYIFCINTYCSAVNQLYDIEIDKINKPYLPLVSGELTIGTGIAIALATALAVLGIAYFSGSKHLLWGALLSLFIFSAYSVNLPLLRWKKSAFGGMFTHVAGFGIVLQLSTYLFMQTEVFKRQAYIPRPLAFGLISASIFAAVVSAFKDIPDIEGDRKNNIKSLATRLGPKMVFWICVSMMQVNFALAIIVGATSSHLWSKIITIIGHAILASILWKQANLVDLSKNDKIQSFYMFIFKLLCTEYLLIPLVR